MADNMSVTTARHTSVPLSDELDTKLVEFLLNEHQPILIGVLILMGTVIISANRCIVVTSAGGLFTDIDILWVQWPSIRLRRSWRNEYRFLYSSFTPIFFERLVTHSQLPSVIDIIPKSCILKILLKMKRRPFLVLFFTLSLSLVRFTPPSLSFSVVLAFYKNLRTKMWPVLYMTLSACDLVGGVAGTS